jgi:hypothetical protein
MRLGKLRCRRRADENAQRRLIGAGELSFAESVRVLPPASAGKANSRE